MTGVLGVGVVIEMWVSFVGRMVLVLVDETYLLLVLEAIWLL